MNPRLLQRFFLLACAVAAGLFAAAPARAAQFVSISTGVNHTCATKADGTAWCWGEGRQGQVGVIGAVRPRTPIYVIGSYQTASISSGQNYWCGLLRDATVSCTGANNRGQVGDGRGSTAQFPQENALTAVTKVSAGEATACAVHSGGLVSCWGDGIRGQLGNGQLRSEPTLSPELVPGLTGIVDVAVGETHACAVRGDGQVFCWGDASDFKLGNDVGSAITVPGVPVRGVTDAVAVVAGYRHSCALRRDGSVVCWGTGSTGQLGTGQDYAASGTAVQIPRLTGVTQLAATGGTTCAVKRDGTAVCWGDGTSGQIGNGSRTSANSPQTVKGITDAAQIAVGNQHACLVTRSQAPFCWGRNNSAQLGTGEKLSQVALTPQLVQDFVLGPATFLAGDLAGLPTGTTSGGVVVFKEFDVSRRSGLTCPKRASIRLTARGRTAVRKASVERVRNGCTVSGRFLLARDTADPSKVRYRISGDGLRTKTGSLRPRNE